MAHQRLSGPAVETQHDEQTARHVLAQEVAGRAAAISTGKFSLKAFM